MPESTGRIAPAAQVQPPAAEPEKPIRRKRGLRIALLSFASVIVLLGAVAAGGFAYINHEVGNIQRIPVKFTALDASGTAGGMTILLTTYQSGYTGTGTDTTDTGQAGLIMLLHINANRKAGGVVSIPPLAEMQVPGHGLMQLHDVLSVGGPSLMVKTVQSLTGVPINHYARINFDRTAKVVNALGGVTVTLPKKDQAFGHEFKAGVNQLNGVTAVDYVRQQSLTEQQRVLRQQNLMRAMLTKLAQERLLINPVTMVRVLKAITGALSVDSNLSNSQIEKLATELGHLGVGSAAFVTAPVKATGDTEALDTAVTSQLWNAINHDSLEA
jgi:LCP family protein required for cell wall assembly